MAFLPIPSCNPVPIPVPQTLRVYVRCTWPTFQTIYHFKRNAVLHANAEPQYTFDVSIL
ncbi:hypothetical protein BKA67DRAFT_269374 [Truncatella angustata]|uniref:Uncharacterized protein n=1 Tax=Truncatella angustata TaxID=152316 RepID=A0A9P8UKR9_9PEZI|nr:uncharacterized protein BKA67DRAFT_269374 [Truncatella angustata]KAH6654072.1 hypothetical protein BKA67DRAFT_269374 [Truncatella angustata]